MALIDWWVVLARAQRVEVNVVPSRRSASLYAVATTKRDEKERETHLGERLRGER